MPTPHPTGVTREGVRIRTDRFGDSWTVHTGKRAAEIRAAVRREQAEALARYDRNPTAKNRAAFAALADTEKVVGERLAETASREAA